MQDSPHFAMNFIKHILKQFLPKTIVRALQNIKNRIALSDKQYKIKIANDIKRLEGLPVPSPSSGPSFTFMTSVYAKTNTKFFLRTAKSVLGQTYTNYEWVVLQHGPISDSLSKALDHMARAKQIKLFHVKKNLGLLGGIRYCLHQATKDYVIPMDADDLIVPPALATIARSILEHNYPDYCYTNESLVRESTVYNPFYRPPWDPVLGLAGSYVFHMAIFKREEALKLKIYSDDRISYCHDWDTLWRFAEVGKNIQHVPEVLYRWRMHSNSISNSGDIQDINQETQPLVLKHILKAWGLEDQFDITEFPIFRGATEFRYQWRNKHNFLPVHLVVIQPDSTNKKTLDIPAFIQSAKIPEQQVYSLGTPTTPYLYQQAVDGRKSTDLSDLIQDIPADHVIWIVDGRLSPVATWFLDETSCWFTLISDLDFLSGSITDENNVIIDGCNMFTFNGLQGSINAGYPMDWGGPWGLALRAQSIDIPHSCFFAARAAKLKQALASIPESVESTALGPWLGVWARKNNSRVAWSPLLRATCPISFSTEMLSSEEEKSAFLLINAEYASTSQWYSDELYTVQGKGWQAPGMLI